MGTLRLLLAVSVVAFHAGPIFGFRGMGAEAVPAFFVISGFYMALILETTYRGAVWTFYGNRLLRLFPLYWAVLLLIAVLAMVPSVGIEMIDNQTFSARMQFKAATETWMGAIPNLLIVGSDWLRQLTFDRVEGEVHWWLYGVPAGPGIVPLYQYLAVPQIWSVAVELTFYAAAPALILLRTQMLIALCAVAAIVGPMLTINLGYRHMLPTANFWYFMLGMIAWRALPRLDGAPRSLHLALVAVTFAVLIGWPLLSGPQVRDGLNVSILIVIFSVGLPSLFVLSKDWRTDRIIGDLSYPLFITHMLFQFATTGFGTYSGPLCLAVSLVVSVVLLLIVQEPIDRYRRVRAQHARPSFAG